MWYFWPYIYAYNIIIFVLSLSVPFLLLFVLGIANSFHFSFKFCRFFCWKKVPKRFLVVSLKIRSWAEKKTHKYTWFELQKKVNGFVVSKWFFKYIHTVQCVFCCCFCVSRLVSWTVWLTYKYFLIREYIFFFWIWLSFTFKLKSVSGRVLLAAAAAGVFLLGKYIHKHSFNSYIL